MSRLLIDTNVVIDLLANRDRFHLESAALFSMADKGEITLAVSALTFANTNYIISKIKDPRKARNVLRQLKVLVETLALDDKTTELALNDEKFPDFEDGIQYYSALANQIDVIITRNQKDFKNSKLPVMTAREYISSIQP